MDYETTPAPESNPRHEMPFIYRRGHLHPDEMNPKFDFNIMKPVPNLLPSNNHSDPQSTS